MVAMKITKSQKAYFGLLTVGLIALGVDRYVLTPPAAQAADDAQSLLVKQGDSVTSGDVTAASPAAFTIKTNAIADKLKKLSDSQPAANGEIRDAFTPGAAWIAANTPPAPPAAPPPPHAEVPNFSQTHHLTGVLVSGRTGQAMIDSKDVMIGQTSTVISSPP